jgi:hypothetical protein
MSKRYAMFIKDSFRYIKVMYNLNLNREYNHLSAFMNKNLPKEQELDSHIIIKCFLNKNNTINKKTLYWLLGIGKRFYQVDVDYNKFVENLFVRNLSLRERFPFFRYEKVTTPFRHKQKFVKNNSVLRTKKTNVHERNIKDYKKYKKTYKDNQKHEDRSYRAYSFKKGNKALRRIAKVQIKNEEYDLIPKIDQLSDPWSW